MRSLFWIEMQHLHNIWCLLSQGESSGSLVCVLSVLLQAAALTEFKLILQLKLWLTPTVSALLRTFTPNTRSSNTFSHHALLCLFFTPATSRQSVCFQFEVSCDSHWKHTDCLKITVVFKVLYIFFFLFCPALQRGRIINKNTFLQRDLIRGKKSPHDSKLAHPQHF